MTTTYTFICDDCGKKLRLDDPDPISLPEHGCAERQRQNADKD